jgi:23S rRNA (adenine2503-C2)-methyltransferase
MTDLKSLDLPALEKFVAGLGWEKYRARQIFTWIWQRAVSDFDAMTDIAKPRRAELKEKTTISVLKPVGTIRAGDGTTKFAFELEDGLRIESVFIPEPPRRTVCVSSQVGCALGCDLCFTGQAGFRRDLRFHEIADQALQASRLAASDLSDRSDKSDRIAPVLTNVVLMGMGEPMLNLDEVLKACEIINSDLALKIGARHITISTAGIPDGIRRLADHPKQFKLAVSLNATNDETRDRLMPVNRRYPMAEVFEAIRYYTGKTHKRVTFEYVLIRGTNDAPADAQRLIHLLRYIPCKINLIPFNFCPNRDYQRPTPESVEAFAAILYPDLPAVSIRKSKGAEIQAACGQLSGQTSLPGCRADG